eukprot:TRINITY_DN14980_c0_g1_i1.p1 TRINITY_DN14980_c0_g1~~TRINITY_DN14980_c0_g1_i1.p1  ORF type:complete len:548 (-),score=34.17 TRINITY_DN14980_c0_g1_i1:184-1827(-)
MVKYIACLVGVAYASRPLVSFGDPKHRGRSDDAHAHHHDCQKNEVVTPLVVYFIIICFIVAAPCAYTVRRVRDRLNLYDARVARGRHTTLAQFHGAGETPGVLLLTCAFSLALSSMNLTVALPNMHEIVKSFAGSVSISGAVLGVYGFGALLGLPLFMHFVRESFRGGFIAQGLLLVLGNSAWLLVVAKHVSFRCLVVGRLLCGLEGSSEMVCHYAIRTCTSHNWMLKAFTIAHMMSDFGACLGFALSSFSREYPVTDLVSEEALPTFDILILCLSFLVIVLVNFPHQSEMLFIGCTHHDTHSHSHHSARASMESSSHHFPRRGSRDSAGFFQSAQADKELLELEVARLAFVTAFNTNLLKTTQRTSWEAFAMLLLSDVYQLGSITSGYFMCMCALAVVASGFLVLLGSGTSFLGLARKISICQAVGIIVMVRFSDPGTTRLVLFLVGSAIFYGSNAMHMVPVNAAVTDFMLQKHAFLDDVHFHALIIFAKYSGVLVGPIISRMFQGHCEHQNMGVALFGLVFLFQGFIIEICLRTLKDCRYALHLN